MFAWVYQVVSASMLSDPSFRLLRKHWQNLLDKISHDLHCLCSVSRKSASIKNEMQLPKR